MKVYNREPEDIGELDHDEADDDLPELKGGEECRMALERAIQLIGLGEAGDYMCCHESSNRMKNGQNGETNNGWSVYKHSLTRNKVYLRLDSTVEHCRLQLSRATSGKRTYTWALTVELEEAQESGQCTDVFEFLLAIPEIGLSRAKLLVDQYGPATLSELHELCLLGALSDLTEIGSYAEEKVLDRLAQASPYWAFNDAVERGATLQEANALRPPKTLRPQL